MMDCMLQLVESPRPYYSVLTCAVTSKTNLNSMKVPHYSNKKYWPFKYLVTGAKGEEGGEEEGRGGGRGGGKRRGERRGESAKGKREESLLSPIPLPFSLPPNSTLFSRYT